MDIRKIQYFAAIAEHKSLSKAAAVLFLSQPALSRQVHLLEEELEAPLFFRNGRGMELTEAGQRFLEASQVVLEQINKASTEIKAMRASPSGQVVVGIPPMIGDVINASLAMRFRKRFPQISMTIMEGLSGLVLEWLTMGRIDVGILYNAVPSSTLQIEPMLRDDLCVVASPASDLPDDIITLREAAKHPIIIASRQHGLRKLVEATAAAHNLSLNVVLEIDALRSTVDLVETGIGCTFLPASAVQRRVKAGTLKTIQLVDPTIVGTLSLSSSTQRPHTPATRHLIDCIREEMRELVHTGIWGTTKPIMAEPTQQR